MCWCHLESETDIFCLQFSVCVAIVAGLEVASGGVVFAFMYTNEVSKPQP